MKKRISFFIALLLIFSVFLSSCQGGGETPGEDNTTGGEDGEGESEYMNLLDYNISLLCANTDMNAFSAAFELSQMLREKLDLTLNIRDESYTGGEYEIVVGKIESRLGDERGFADIESVANARIAALFIHSYENKLIIGASSSDAYLLALDKLSEYIDEEKGSLEIPKDFGYSLTFDAAIYREKKEIVEYSEASLASLTALAEIKVGGKALSLIRSDARNFACEISFIDDYPTVSATAAVSGATVVVTQANADKGEAVIRVTSKDGFYSSEYRVVFDVKDDYSTAAEVLLKDGKKGTVSFVADDGGHSTATFIAKTMGAKYRSLKVSFAVITKALVELKTQTVGNDTYWAIDTEGNYIYTKNQDAWDYWQDILSDTRFDVLSHSHTHAYWGDDDEGGSYEYRKNDGTTATSEVFPKGNVTKELVASQQIVRELGQKGLVYIKPGVGAALSQYYFDMLASGSVYIGARTTAYNPTEPTKMLNYASDFKTNASRYNVKAYMVQHYEVSESVPKAATTAQCLASDVTYWKDYIDAAIEKNAWACFCIHNIADDSYNAANGGHFIYQSQADKIFGYADSLADELWIASYTEATVYYHQLSSAKVTATAHRDEYVDVTLTHSEVGDCYDMPMTVKVTVHGSWEYAKTSGNTLLTVYEDSDGSKYVQLDITPGETVRITVVS